MGANNSIAPKQPSYDEVISDETERCWEEYQLGFSGTELTDPLDILIASSGMEAAFTIPALPKRLDHATHRFMPNSPRNRGLDKLTPLSTISDMSESDLAMWALGLAIRRGVSVSPLDAAKFI